jgi:hypothetical protein
MKKKIMLFQPALFIFFSFWVMKADAQDVRLKISIQPKEARSLAQKELPKVLQWIEPEELESYGFSKNDDFSKIFVGRPFYLTSIDLVKQMEQTREGSIEIQAMMLPLLLDKSVRCFIYLSFEDNQWKAVGIGSKEYAAKNSDAFNKNDDNASLIIAIHQIQEEFISDKPVSVTTSDKSVPVNTYKPIFGSNKDARKENYSLNELVGLFDESLKTIK